MFLIHARNGFDGGRDKRSKGPPQNERAVSAAMSEDRGPPIRGYSRASRKSPQLADCLVGLGRFEPSTTRCHFRGDLRLITAADGTQTSVDGTQKRERRQGRTA